MNEKEQKRVFSENLRFYIERSGHQQKDIANVLGVGASTFNAWVKGKSIPNISKVQMIADYFGVGKSALLDAHDNEQEATAREAAVLYNRLTPQDKASVNEFMRFKLSGEAYANDRHKKTHRAARNEVE